MKEINVLESPGLETFLAVCRDLPKEERRQYEALSGLEYSADDMAASLTLIAGPKWGIVTARGEPLAVGGYTQERPGVWRSWMLARDPCWADYAEAVTQVVNGVMGVMFTDMKATRLETQCLADRAQARRWYEKHLGLQCEGVFRAAGVNQEDVAVYAKVRI